jgi:hypothetical protein
MALQANHQVIIPGADKTQATVLAVEFWTSKGFTVQSSSYNCIVLRRNGYTSVSEIGAWTRFRKGLGDLVNELASEKDKPVRNNIPWDEIPVELTVLCRVLPKETKWDLNFKLGEGYIETNPGGFSIASRSWCDEFADFCRQWMNNASS